MRRWRCVNMADTLQRELHQQTKQSLDAKILREKLTAWDTKDIPKAPLTDKQKDSFMELATQWSNRPLPTEPELPLDDSLSQPPPSVVGSGGDVLSQQLSQLAEQKIENAQQFFLWFSEVEEKIEEEEQFQNSEYMDDLKAYRDECGSVLSEVSQALSFLSELKCKYVNVSMKTNALHEACENLLEEQSQLMNTAECINSKLSFFNELDRLSTKLNSQTLSVTSESFIPMLSRLDECIAYLRTNPQFRESELFLAKYRHCLSRALSLIRTHVFNILNGATQQVLPNKEIPAPADDAFTLFYGKFRANAPRVKGLLDQIQQRTDKGPEYDQLLRDCHQCYFQQRELLLGPSITNAVKELAGKHVRDHCALVRSGSAFMVHVCEDEHQLFYHFFSHATPLLDAMLEGFCHKLYDVFRPLIIHINHLETLAELCSILKVEMLEEHVQNSSQELGAFEAVCEQMLEDVQERLVYRTHIYIREEILNYKPAGGDLAYPDKLEMMESIAASLRQGGLTRQGSTASSTGSLTSLEVAQINSSVTPAGGSTMPLHEPTSFVNIPLHEPGLMSNMPMSPADLHGMWYPTVRRTLVCLSKLYRCIDKTTFQGLSQETLSMCVHSLVKASDLIVKKKSLLDSQLFLIKHLLILREQIAPFQVNFVIKETGVDFSKVRDAAKGLYAARSKLFALSTNNAVLQFLLEGTPQPLETYVDSKKEVDQQLKTTCEDFIHHTSEELVGPLKAFITKADVIVKMNNEDGGRQVSLRLQPFASPEKVHDVVMETYRRLKKRKLEVQRSMTLYLANRDTEYILFKPIKSQILNSFQQLITILEANYSEEDQQIIGSPTLEQINLLLTSTQNKVHPRRSVEDQPSPLPAVTPNAASRLGINPDMALLNNTTPQAAVSDVLSSASDVLSSASDVLSSAASHIPQSTVDNAPETANTTEHVITTGDAGT
ncbi:hypothetical protein NP493_132g06036 [Ridgeia piscesae]|uniref:Conserved oligomeric Golgi complex subunit 3 n=1 Tax=Ridgeia piscesae TaxID=27915 RepID=A0AAD9UGH5_RIDPI|nr:hypothetical protein NP493_132g06036 [Ridgeia piscesae]